MKTVELIIEIQAMLSALHLKYKKLLIGSYLPEAFMVEDFGVIVAGIDRKDYTQVQSKLALEYPDHKLFFMVGDDNLLEKKDELIWELMRSGYMRFIRKNYTRQFNNLIQSGFGRKIVTERLRIWNDKQCYKYFIEENKLALQTPDSYVLSSDPAFFDYMPEENTKGE